MSSDAQVICKHSMCTTQASSTISQKLDDFVKTSFQTVLKLQSDMKDFRTKRVAAAQGFIAVEKDVAGMNAAADAV
ncbi:hypothetical protein FB107DRAFT_274053 [Schizophyllum commune]